MQETFEFKDNINDALASLVRVCGGPKVCACLIWPEKDPINAAHWLTDCLDSNKAAKLSPDDLLSLLKIGRERNCHIALNYICDQIGYAHPATKSPEEELIDVYREYTHSVEYQKRLAERIQIQESRL